MGSRREKAGMLILGIFFGLLIGGSIFFWQRNLGSTEWISFSRIRGLIGQVFEKQDDFLSHIRTQIYPGSKEKKQVPAGQYHLDSTSANLSEDSLRYYDSIQLIQGGGLDYYIDLPGLSDSLLKAEGYVAHPHWNDSLRLSDSLRTFHSKGRNNEAVIRRDEMVGVKILRIKGLADSIFNPLAYADSLLTNDKQAKRYLSNQVRVEFWNSPINYKGYRLSKNKIVLYGIDEPETVSLEYVNQSVYLRHKNKYYRLERGEVLRPFLLVNRSEIFSKPSKP